MIVTKTVNKFTLSNELKHDNQTNKIFTSKYTQIKHLTMIKLINISSKIYIYMCVKMSVQTI